MGASPRVLVGPLTWGVDGSMVTTVGQPSATSVTDAATDAPAPFAESSAAGERSRTTTLRPFPSGSPACGLPLAQADEADRIRSHGERGVVGDDGLVMAPRFKLLEDTPKGFVSSPTHASTICFLHAETNHGLRRTFRVISNRGSYPDGSCLPRDQAISWRSRLLRQALQPKGISKD